MIGLLKKRNNRKSSAAKLVSILNNRAITKVIDIGANIGQTHDKLRVAGFTGEIISIEPTSVAHAVISEAAKKDPNWIIAPRMALGTEEGEVTINVSKASDMSSIMTPSEDLLKALPKTEIQTTETVIIKPLDSIYTDYCSDQDAVFLKIDTQGFEREVLKGAAETLTKIEGIQMELSLFALYEGEETYLSFVKDLHGWGFEPHMIFETNFSRKLLRQLQIDVVFMRG